MIISLWAILATIICIWLICTEHDYLGIPWLILGCLVVYMFLPLILFVTLIYLIIALLGKSGRSD